MNADMCKAEYIAEVEALVFTPAQLAEAKANIEKHARKSLERFEAADGEMEHLAHLPSAAAAAWQLGDHARAAALADETLGTAEAQRGTWNHGNAVHKGHTVRGLLALEAGDVNAALAALHAAGATPGSPQLNSFGPTMELAAALLRLGHADAVLAYLAQCRVFWAMGTEELDAWETRVRAGAVPNFFQHTHVF